MRRSQGWKAHFRPLQRQGDFHQENWIARLPNRTSDKLKGLCFLSWHSIEDPFKIEVLLPNSFREMQLLKRPAFAAGISCAKEQQSLCLLHPDWIHSLASSNQRGLTAWLRMNFQNATMVLKSVSRSNGRLTSLLLCMGSPKVLYLDLYFFFRTPMIYTPAQTNLTFVCLPTTPKFSTPIKNLEKDPWKCHEFWIECISVVNTEQINTKPKQIKFCYLPPVSQTSSLCSHNM